MKIYKKALIALLLSIFSLVFYSQNEVNASTTLEAWSYPSEWDLVDYMTSPALVDVLVDSSNLSRPNKFGTISGTSDAFFEYQYTVLHGYDEMHNYHYIAVIMDIWMSPNNLSDDNCRSDLLVVTSSLADGYLVQGAPLSQGDVTVVTSSIGGSLQIGAQGSVPTASISGSFTTSKTDNEYDLEVSGYRLKINPTDTYTRKYKVEYDYYDPYRNDCNYIESTSMLQYGVIYKVPSITNTINVDWNFDAFFIYDHWLWNSDIFNSFSYDMNINVNSNEVTFS